MKKLSIIIPVYYNEESLIDLYEDLKKEVLSKLEAYEIVMVDDGSKDHSYDVMKVLAQHDKNIKLIKLSRNFGSHAALLAGLVRCTGDCAVIKTADLQEPSRLILEMYTKWKQGNKVVLAVRDGRDEPRGQKFFANMYYRLMKNTTNLNMPEGGFDCFLVDRKVIHVLEEMEEKNTSLMMQVLWCGFKSDSVHYFREKRKKGNSKWTLGKKIKLVVDSLLGFSFIPIRAITVIGLIFTLLSFVLMAITLFSKLIGNIAVDGYTTLMIVLLLSNGIIIVTLGIIGEYLWRAFDASRHRPVYIIEEE